MIGKVLGSVTLALAVSAGAPGRASAQSSGPLVTIAARVCDSYPDVTANRARNDIMESLRDLGANTFYGGGQPISPSKEAAGQPACLPLPGWRFTLGTGLRVRAVDGPWGSLAKVLDPYPTPIATQAEVPLLNDDGQGTGARLAGATTIELTADQALRARRPSQLWIQGGTPADPVLNAEYPGQFGFAALRCGVDNLNGDNVEYISFPSGSTHVFCFAYYVAPPPTSGTIIVTKRVIDEDASETFPFDGDLSYGPGGRFDLAAAAGRPGERSFIRAETRPGEPPWTVRELVPDGWRLTDLACDTRNRASSAATDVSTARAEIRLGAGDVVRCTFTDVRILPTHGLTLRKVTLGGTGRFHFTVRAAAGGDVHDAATGTTTEGVAEDAAPLLDLPAGRYLLDERMPAASGGRWSLAAISCDDRRLPRRLPATIEIGGRAGHACTFTNRYTPRGSISVDKVAHGALGPVGFVISPLARRPVGPAEYLQGATLTERGVATRARGDATDHLPLGSYAIEELSTGEGHVLVSVECDGEAVPFSAGRAVVRLTRQRPSAHCTFVNDDLVIPPDLEPPAAVTSTGETPTLLQLVQPTADLRVVKRAGTARVVLGDVITYTVTVTNAGPAAAHGVVLNEDPLQPAALVSAHITRGSCRGSLPLACVVGTLAMGQEAVLVVRMRPLRAGRFANTAVVGEATEDPRIEDDQSRQLEAVEERRPTPPRFTG